MKLYIAWTLHGREYADIFDTWEAYHAAMYSPEIEIQLIEVIKA